MSGKCQTAYDVDFLPIIHQAQLEEATFIRWSNDEVLPQFQSAIAQRVSREISSHEYDAVLPENSFIRRHLLEGLYRDALVANALNSPFSVDFNAIKVIGAQQKKASEIWANEIPGAFFKYWVNLELPDLSMLGWQELYEFRESDRGKSFRDMIHRISGRLKGVLPGIDEQRALDDWISKEFNKELLVELSRRINTPAKIIASICLNFIPFGFIPGIAMDAVALGGDQNSWVSLVKGYRL